MAQRDMNTLIKCEYCGEYYSATYKECPFCDDFEDDYYEDDYQETPRRRSTHHGRRLVTNKRGGGYGRGWSAGRILLTIGSIGMIVAAICIVFTILKPLIDRGNVDDPTDPPSPPVSDQSPLPSDDLPTEPPVPSGDPVDDPEPSGGDVPADQTATGFTLSHKDFSFSNQYPAPITIKVTFSPAGSTGFITWTSSDPDVATVDENGKVSHGTKAGTTTITATMAGGAKQTCTVRSTISGSSAPSPSPSPSASTSPNTNLSLNKTDFTFSSLNEPAVQMKVNGTSSTPTWSIGNTSVATISSDGKVRPVGNGTTNVTCTVDGQTLKCIVRVNLR